jgi:hypothetical protein
MNFTPRTADQLTADELETGFVVMRAIVNTYELVRDNAPDTSTLHFARRRVRQGESFLDEIHDRYKTATGREV